MSFKKMSVYLSPKEFERVSSEALIRGESSSRCARSMISECISLRDELMPNDWRLSGDGAKQHMLQVLLAKTEERIAKSIDAQAEHTQNINETLERLRVMLEKYVFLYLQHSPEVGEEKQDIMFEAAKRRFLKWQYACVEGVNNVIPKDIEDQSNDLSYDKK